MKKTAKYLSRIICVMLSFAVVCSCFSVCAFAKASYISEVALASGSGATEKLENSGYTVLFQGMNLMTGDDDSMVYLGYKKGSSAITNFIVSSKAESSITYQGCTYNAVSDINLNNGTNGTALYLYSTKDSTAGNGITKLDTVSGFSDKDKVLSLKNDGSSPVRTDDDKLANFDDGIENSELYLLMYRDSSIRQYISNACIVTADSKANAVNEAASNGCDYYVDADLSDDNDKVVYIAYQRTADKSQAINAVSISGEELNITKGENTGGYLIDLASSRLFKENFSLGDWAGVYAAMDKCVTKTSKEYQALANSTEACSCVYTGDLNIYASYIGTVQAVAEDPQNTEETTAQGEATDEFYDIEKEETTTAAQDESEESDKTASVFGSGAIKTIAIFAGVIIVVSVVIFAIKKGKKKNGKKLDNDDERQEEE